MYNSEQAKKALNEISDAIDILDGFGDVRVTKDFIDTIASLDARLKRLDKLNQNFRGLIKSSIMEAGDSIRQGNSFEGVLQFITKEVLNTTKVKAFLGKKLYQFMDERPEVHLIFRAKT